MPDQTASPPRGAAGMSNLPNLVVIGAMKCGTSSLHEYLGRHPDIFMSRRKEIDFFSGNNAGQSLDWYRSHFPTDRPLRGESSQNYSKAHNPAFAGAPKRMAQIIPEARLIYLVRDPIERYRSHLVENYLGETAETRRRNAEMDTYVRTGLYHWQLSFFLRHFPLERVLVVDAAELQRDRLNTMNRIFAFLGAAPVHDDGLFAFEANANGEDVMPAGLRNRLPMRLLRRVAPGLLHRVVAAPAVRRRLFPGSYKPQLAPDERARLAERFAPDVAALRALTGQRFASWQV